MKNWIINLWNKIKDKDSVTSRSFSALFYSFLGAGCSKICIMAMNALLARILGQELYGQYSTVYSAIQTFVTFSSGGIGASMVRYSALYRNNNKKICGQIVSTLFCVSLILCATIMSGLIVFSDPISKLIAGDNGLSIYLKIGSIVILLVAVSSILQNILIGFEKFRRSTFIDIIYGVALICVVSILAYFKGIVGALIGLIIARLFSSFLFFISTFHIFKKESIPIKVKFDSIIKDPLFKFTIPSFVAAISVVPVTFITNAMLVQHSGYAEMAIYNVAAQWVSIIAYITVLFTKVKPIYVELLSKGENNRFVSLIKKMVVISTLSGTLLSVILICLSDPILSIYGNEYKSGIVVFVVMVATAILISTQSQFGAVLEALGKMRIGMILNLVWGGNLILLFYLLIDKGALGYAIAYLCSYALHCIYSWIIVIIEIKRIRKRTE